MKNLEIAKIFERTADVLALLDENAFRILAYRKIARVLEELPHAVEKLAESGELQNVAGIGKSSAERIDEYLRTGRIAEFEELLAQIPPGVLEMIRIPSMGPKTAMLLWREGGVTTLAELKEKIEADVAAGGGRLMGIKGIGEKKLKKIAENLVHLAASSGRIRLGEALPIAEEFVAFLRTLKGVEQAQYCGSLRRGKETIGDIDIAVSAPAAAARAIGEAVVRHTFAAQTIQVGDSKTSIRTGNGIQIDVRVVPPESLGAAMQYFTGSTEHNVRLREIAIKKGLKLNEWGLFKTENGKEIPIAGKTESEIYAALGLACMPPEMRENRGEIEWGLAHFAAAPAADSPPPSSATKGSAKRAGAARGGSKATAKPADASPIPASIAPALPLAAPPSPPTAPAIELVELRHIRGDLHMHTTASDGSNSIEELVAEAKRRGYEYIAVTDHSKSQFQANGLRPDRLLEHIQAIHAVAKEAEKSGILLLAGSEVDILADGSLDYEDDILAKLDWVVASPHAALSQEHEAATQRLTRVAANPHVCVIGHPTGRMVPSRRGLEPDMSAVIFAAARHGIAMEINANYHRLDLRDVHVRMAVEASVPICINTDVHALADFDQMRYGILTARRGWATPAHVLNTRPREEFKKWLSNRKQLASW